jgi:hypothetical protein
MMGSRIVCEFDGKEHVCEVAAEPILDAETGNVIIYVYHENKFKPLTFELGEDIKVIEKFTN